MSSINKHKKSISIEFEIREEDIRQEQIEQFQEHVLEYVDDGLLYSEAITQSCEDNGLDVEFIRGLLSPYLVQKLYEESISRHLIKETNSSLPI